MDDLISSLDALKISALSKSAMLNEQIHEVTIGPNACLHQTHEKTPPPKESVVINISVSPKPLKSVESPFKYVINDLEEKRQETVQEAISIRIQKVIAHDKLQQDRFSQQWAIKQQLFMERNDTQERNIIKVMKEYDLQSDQENQKVLSYYQGLAEKRKEYDKVIKLKQEKNRKINACIDSIQKGQLEFRNIYMEVIQILQDTSEDCKKGLTEHIKTIKLLTPQIDEIMNKCKSVNIDEQDMIKCMEIVNYAKISKNKIKEIVENFEKQKLLALEEMQRQENEKRLAEQKAKEEKAQEMIKAASIVNKPNNELASFVSKSALKMYSELQVFLQQHTENYKSLTEDNTLKSFKFECRKIINLAVNSISAVGPEHLLDKYNKLYNLLSGKPVPADNNSYVTATKHPQGISFCMNLLARKFVLQGDMNISPNPKSVFCYATVIISLWNDFPEFGKLLLAHFYQECPYLIPFYPPKSANQSDKDYYTSLGYQYKDEQVEKQDKFLKRMGGIFRLYFAILVTEPKRSQNQHSHDLTNGWTWLARIINMEPRSDITAMALIEFLEVAGCTMQKVYAKQFKKILYFISTSYLQTIKNLDSGGPATRLELLLEEYNSKNGNFEEPVGILQKNFW